MAKIDPQEPCPCGSGKSYADCHQKQVGRAPEIKIRVPLTVIPEPDPGARSVFIFAGEGTTLFQGQQSTISFDCGKCGACLMVGMAVGQVRGIVIRCNGCGSFNDT